jgi:hypothetical protein
MLQLLPSVAHRIAPEVHPVDEAVLLDELDVCIVALVLVIIAVVAPELELLAQTIAPLIHLVPDETDPMLTNALFTQTDQLSPSEEHRITPVVHPEGVEEDVELVLEEVEVVAVDVEVEIEDDEVEDVEEDVELEVVLELEPDKLPPVPTTVTSRLLPAMLAQSEVLGTFVSPA